MSLVSTLPLTWLNKRMINTLPYLLWTGDASNLGLKDNSFDVVIFSFNGIDYIYPYIKRLAALKEIRRVLKTNGLFIFSSHNHCIPRDREGILPFIQYIFKKKPKLFYRFNECLGHNQIVLDYPLSTEKRTI